MDTFVRPFGVFYSLLAPLSIAAYMEPMYVNGVNGMRPMTAGEAWLFINAMAAIFSFIGALSCFAILLSYKFDGQDFGPKHRISEEERSARRARFMVLLGLVFLASLCGLTILWEVPGTERDLLTIVAVAAWLAFVSSTILTSLHRAFKDASLVQPQHE